MIVIKQGEGVEEVNVTMNQHGTYSSKKFPCQKIRILDSLPVVLCFASRPEPNSGAHRNSRRQQEK